MAFVNTGTMTGSVRQIGIINTDQIGICGMPNEAQETVDSAAIWLLAVFLQGSTVVLRFDSEENAKAGVTTLTGITL